MSSARGLGAGGWGGPAVIWRPGRPIRPAAVGRGGAGLRSLPSGFGCPGLLQCVRACGLVSAGGNSSRGLHSGAGGVGPGVSRVCAGDVCGSPRRVCFLGCRVWWAVGSGPREGLWRVCVVVRAGGGGPCRGARGCARW